MTDTIAELRELLAAERKALRAMKESGGPNDALLDAWLKASGKLNRASIAALPALLNELERKTKALEGVRAWIASLTVTDMNEVVADNGITAGMVVGQEAIEQLRRIDALKGTPND